MQKRTIITIAGATTLTLLASSSALAVNLRGVDNVSPGDVGTFTPKDTTPAVAPQIATVYVDVPTTPVAVAPSPSPSPSAPLAGIAPPQPAVTLATAPPASGPVTTTQASSYSDDDEHEGETEDHESEDHESEESGGHDDD